MSRHDTLFPALSFSNQRAMNSASDIFFPIIYVLIFWLLAAAPYVLRGRSWQSIDPFEPYVGLTIILFFYSMSALIGFQLNGLADDLQAVSPNAILKFALACILGQIGFACGEYLGWDPDAGSRQRVLFHDQRGIALESALLRAGVAFALLMLPFYWDRFDLFNVESYSETALESRLVRMEDVNAGVKDVFLRDMPMTLLLCAATVFLLDRRRILGLRVIAAVPIVAYALTSLLSGARGTLVATATLPLLYYHFQVKRFSKIVIVIMGIVTYVGMNVISVARTSSDLASMAGNVQEKINEEGYQFLDISRSTELRTSINLVRLIVGLESGEDSLRLGGITFANIVSAVPRSLWSDRPLTGGEEFAEVFYTGSLAAGAGYGSFLFQDPYWDFGFAGVFLVSLIYGWMIRAVYVALVQDRRSSFWTLCYALIYGNIAVFAIRNGMFAGVKNSFITLVPMFLIAMFAREQAPVAERIPTLDNQAPPSS